MDSLPSWDRFQPMVIWHAITD
ncbi:hypothetical protein IL54_0276 [Sphingobium sp. ba1]|nr:hypothetical protein IL54_0276 [Sphingobium sp. ba1]